MRALSGAAALVSVFLCLPVSAGETCVLDATDFGVAADGQTDDGPAIRRMVDAALEQPGPVRLQFPPGKTICAATAPGRYVFPFDGAEDLVLDGGGSTFLLDPYLRFMSLTHSRRVTVRGLNVDFRPLPFVEGIVEAVNPDGRFVDVRLAEGFAMPPAGEPTGEDGEQAFFSMLWRPGPYGLVSSHYWTARLEPTPASGMLRVFADERFDDFASIEPEKWRVSVPVPGLAHRYGPGPCFRVHDNHTITFEDVELWSAPWFGFNVLRNEGSVVFRRVHIRPKPDSGRIMSLWRDGFHVKGNRASLLWEDCVLEGMNDDAFNISTHSSVVQRMESATRLVVRQKFPLGHVPWRVGDTLTAADETARHLLGSAKIAAVDTGPEPPRIQGLPASPVTTLELDRAIEGLDEGAMVWSADAANPATVLRGCRIRMSCRLQSPVRLEKCNVTALLWFYAEPVEGPFPSGVVVKDCVLRRGRGNPKLAVSVSGQARPDAKGPHATEPPRAIHDLLFTGNEVRGVMAVNGAQDVRMEHNRFVGEDARLLLHDNHGLEMTGNVGLE